MSEIGGMINLLYKWLRDGFVHVGISSRNGNNRIEADYVDVARMNNAYAYDREAVLACGARFDRLKVMEDFDITLTLLEKGYPNRVTYEYAWGQRRSGDEGGCSLYRNDEMQREAALELARLHPGLVKIVEKESKEAWGGFESSTRTDVNIQWKKAFERGSRTGKGIMEFVRR
jgi:hypothetical protein